MRQIDIAEHGGGKRLNTAQCGLQHQRQHEFGVQREITPSLRPNGGRYLSNMSTCAGNLRSSSDKWQVWDTNRATLEPSRPSPLARFKKTAVDPSFQRPAVSPLL